MLRVEDFFITESREERTRSKLDDVKFKIIKTKKKKEHDGLEKKSTADRKEAKKKSNPEKQNTKPASKPASTTIHTTTSKPEIQPKKSTSKAPSATSLVTPILKSAIQPATPTSKLSSTNTNKKASVSTQNKEKSSSVLQSRETESSDGSSSEDELTVEAMKAVEAATKALRASEHALSLARRARKHQDGIENGWPSEQPPSSPPPRPANIVTKRRNEDVSESLSVVHGQGKRQRSLSTAGEEQHDKRDDQEDPGDARCVQYAMERLNEFEVTDANIGKKRIRGQLNRQKKRPTEVPRDSIRIAMRIKSHKEMFLVRKVIKKVLTGCNVDLQLPWSKQNTEKMMRAVKEVLLVLRQHYPFWTAGMARRAIMDLLIDSGRNIRLKARGYKSISGLYYPRGAKRQKKYFTLAGLLDELQNEKASNDREASEEEVEHEGSQNQISRVSSEVDWEFYADSDRESSMEAGEEETINHDVHKNGNLLSGAGKKATISMVEIPKKGVAVSRVKGSRSSALARIFTTSPAPTMDGSQRDVTVDNAVNGVEDTRRSIPVNPTRNQPPTPVPSKQLEKQSSSIDQHASPVATGQEKPPVIKSSITRKSPSVTQHPMPPPPLPPRTKKPSVVAVLRVEFISGIKDFELESSFFISLWKRSPMRQFIACIENALERRLDLENSMLVYIPIDQVGEMIRGKWRLLNDIQNIVDLFIHEGVGSGRGVFMTEESLLEKFKDVIDSGELQVDTYARLLKKEYFADNQVGFVKDVAFTEQEIKELEFVTIDGHERSEKVRFNYHRGLGEAVGHVSTYKDQLEDELDMDERAAGLEKVMEFERMGGTLGSTGAYPSGRRGSSVASRGSSVQPVRIQRERTRPASVRPSPSPSLPMSTTQLNTPILNGRSPIDSTTNEHRTFQRDERSRVDGSSTGVDLPTLSSHHLKPTQSTSIAKASGAGFAFSTRQLQTTQPTSIAMANEDASGFSTPHLQTKQPVTIAKTSKPGFSDAITINTSTPVRETDELSFNSSDDHLFNSLVAKCDIGQETQQLKHVMLPADMDMDLRELLGQPIRMSTEELNERTMKKLAAEAAEIQAAKGKTTTTRKIPVIRDSPASVHNGMAVLGDSKTQAQQVSFGFVLDAEKTEKLGGIDAKNLQDRIPEVQVKGSTPARAPSKSTNPVVQVPESSPAEEPDSSLEVLSVTVKKGTFLSAKNVSGLSMPPPAPPSPVSVRPTGHRQGLQFPRASGPTRENNLGLSNRSYPAIHQKESHTSLTSSKAPGNTRQSIKTLISEDDLETEEEKLILTQSRGLKARSEASTERIAKRINSKMESIALLKSSMKRIDNQPHLTRSTTKIKEILEDALHSEEAKPVHGPGVRPSRYLLHSLENVEQAVDQVCSLLGYPTQKNRYTKQMKAVVAAVRAKLKESKDSFALRETDWVKFATDVAARVTPPRNGPRYGVESGKSVNSTAPPVPVRPSYKTTPPPSLTSEAMSDIVRVQRH